MKNIIKLILGLLAIALLNNAHANTHENINPESASQITTHELVTAENFMVVAANKFASQTGYQILKKGGNAVDAAIAMQMVLNVVEPQSSGIGGGAFLMLYDANKNNLIAWDGRETAPSNAKADRFMLNDKPMPFFDAVNSGLSVATPGILKMLYQAHKENGKLPWVQLFEDAINLAENGFPISNRLHELLSKTDGLKEQATTMAFYYDSSGSPWPVGYILKNPELAQTFKSIAADINNFYSGNIANNIVNAVNNHNVAGDLSLYDLKNYQPIKRQALCFDYKEYKLCGMPPPSSGPITIMQMLGILEHTDIAQHQPESTQAIHYFAEAGRLAFADRGHYVADPDFFTVLSQQLLNKAYLKQRAGLINQNKSMGMADFGVPHGLVSNVGVDNSREAPATTHMSIVDGYGNIVSMTSSIESAFGSKIMVDGFLLNNELTDFAFKPIDKNGVEVANSVQPNKRPRSSMAPMIVFKQNQPYMVIGSPGGSAIINYVAKTILGVLDWGLDIQQAIDLANYGSRNFKTELEINTSLSAKIKELTEMGHDVSQKEFPSGLHGIVINNGLLYGGADPRREGIALGD